MEFMADFKIGDHVFFTHDGHTSERGIITAKEGNKWAVKWTDLFDIVIAYPPEYLTRIADPDQILKEIL